MYEHRLYKYIVARRWVNNQIQMIVAEVDWNYSYEFECPTSWDKLRELGFIDYRDSVIHMWLEKYHNAMYIWLQERNITWVGTQSGDSEIAPGVNRGFTVICVTLANPDHITEFQLTWG